MSDATSHLDLATVRRRLADARGPEYWRSLEELAGSEGFDEMLHREFPRFASEWNDPVGRRRFIQLMGASLALAGLTGCTRQPAETITPYVKQPENLLPGKPLYYASAMTLGGYATGVLVETHEGRPTKIEGNPEHPASLGAADAFMQASVLGLYDPDRSQTLTWLGEIRPWATFLGAMRSAVAAQRALGGAGLRILTETVTSPTLAAQIRALLSELPQARWHQYEPANRDNARNGASLAFGRPLQPVWRFEQADVVLSLDADFLGGEPGSLRHTRDFVGRRAPEGSRFNRLYVAESSPTITGAKADHRTLLPPSGVADVARSVAAAFGIGTAATETRREWVDAVVADLRAHAGAGLVLAGPSQPPAVHALAHAINEALGNVGRSVVYTEPVEAEPVDQVASIRDLAAAMAAGQVDLLLILGGNPVYDAPADLEFAKLLERVELRVRLGLYNDETSELCQWHLPEAHFLEAWSDARAYDGTVSIVQPVILPLYGGHSAHEVLATLTERPERSGLDIVREYWQSQGLGGMDFEAAWRRALHDGAVVGTAAEPVAAPVDVATVARSADALPAGGGTGFEVAFRPDPAVHDGRFANNGWLQELPKPLTKLTWDNAILVSTATARQLGVAVDFSMRGGEHGGAFADVVEIEAGGRTVRGPVWIVPDHPEGSATVFLGYGRRRSGRAGNGAGFDAYVLRASAAPWSIADAAVRRTGDRMLLSNTQGHWNMEGRDIVRSGSLERYREHPDLAPAHAHAEPGPGMTMFPPHEYPGYAWGMSIDLNACTGCNACVVACQAENNIPVVGRDQVAAGREMHWIRVDRYHRGDPQHPEDLETYFQPVVCQQCENAPCEIVCPVAATVHSAEGLNDMVYNRCVGTRYCANNCPYKVRRFNYFLYQDFETPSLKLARNPNVTVRSRGVMEKCTFCVQRINRGKIQAELEGRKVRDGEIQPACQQSCPAGAITFGDINDPSSAVSRRKSEPRNYRLLASLNTRPRTSYLGAVRNWNPELGGHDDDGGHGSGHGS